jgi:hypothetical protein
MNDVVIGAWREGLTKQNKEDIATIEKRYNQGFRLLPFESTVLDLVLTFDAYEEIANDLLMDCCTDCVLLEDELPFLEAPIPPKKPKKVNAAL